MVHPPLPARTRIREAIRLPLRSRNHSLVISASIASGAQRALVMVAVVPWLVSLGHPLTTAATAFGSGLAPILAGLGLIVMSALLRLLDP